MSVFPMIRKGHIRYALKKSTDDRIFLQISYGHAESTHGNLPDSDLDKREPVVAVEMYDRSIKNMETMMRYAKKTLGIKTDTEIPIKVIESWLYSIALNNADNPLGDACEEIIKRLPGLVQYDKDLEEHEGEIPMVDPLFCVFCGNKMANKQTLWMFGNPNREFPLCDDCKHKFSLIHESEDD